MDRKVKWGVIGAGGIARRRTIPAIFETTNAEVVAMMDKDANAILELSREYHIKDIYNNEDDLLANPDVEAVYIASPVCFHMEQARKTLAAGKHLLLEKPIALNVAETEEIAALAAVAGVKAAPAMVMRFHDGHKKIKTLVQEGALGQIVTCRAQLTCWFPDMENNWRQKRAMSGGGALMDMGLHCIDLLCNITGKTPVKVGAMLGTKTFHYEVEDSVSALMELADGPFCTIEAYNNIPDAAAKCRLELYGTKGSVMAEGTIGQDGGGSILVTLSDQSGGYNSAQQRTEDTPAELLEFEKCNIYQKQVESFSKAILENTNPEIILAEGLIAMKTMDAMYQAAKADAFLKIK